MKDQAMYEREISCCPFCGSEVDNTESEEKDTTADLRSLLAHISPTRCRDNSLDIREIVNAIADGYGVLTLAHSDSTLIIAYSNAYEDDARIVRLTLEDISSQVDLGFCGGGDGDGAADN